MARNPSHFGSKRKLPVTGSPSASLASMGSIGGAMGKDALFGGVLISRYRGKELLEL
jgi:hypothetical protein